jgi:tetratricopeptide (TPR) repeat protein
MSHPHTNLPSPTSFESQVLALVETGDVVNALSTLNQFIEDNPDERLHRMRIDLVIQHLRIVPAPKEDGDDEEQDDEATDVIPHEKLASFVQDAHASLVWLEKETPEAFASAHEMLDEHLLQHLKRIDKAMHNARRYTDLEGIQRQSEVLLPLASYFPWLDVLHGLTLLQIAERRGRGRLDDFLSRMLASRNSNNNPEAKDKLLQARASFERALKHLNEGDDYHALTMRWLARVCELLDDLPCAWASYEKARHLGQDVESNLQSLRPKVIKALSERALKRLDALIAQEAWQEAQAMLDDLLVEDATPEHIEKDDLPKGLSLDDIRDFIAQLRVRQADIAYAKRDKDTASSLYKHVLDD